MFGPSPVKERAVPEGNRERLLNLSLKRFDNIAGFWGYCGTLRQSYQKRVRKN
jgi:hypothetical protein